MKRIPRVGGVPTVVFDKGALLGGLYEEGIQAGVDYYLGRNVVEKAIMGHIDQIRKERPEVAAVIEKHWNASAADIVKH